MGFRKVVSDHIKKYRSEVLKDSSASTFDRKMFSLKKFFEWTVKEGYLDENPVESFLREEQETVKTKLGKIERQKKLNPPSYGSAQSRIVAKFAGKPKLQKLAYNLFYARPKWYKSYHNLPIASYFNYAILVLLMSSLGFGVYNQFFKTTSGSLAYPTSLTRAGRYLSFQGRLTNNLGNPITTATNLVFKLYSVDTGGAALWNSGTCSITPDTDGIFSTLLGSSCGTEIASSVFSENSAIWLGVTVGVDAEATPRVQIATVAYAINSETLQGYPASSSATANTVPVMNNLGQIVLAAASPKMQSTSGTFAIEGQALTITTPDASNGSIAINPDGTGTLNLIFEGAAPGGGAGGFVNATNANITSGALYFGQVASNATGYNLLQLKSGATPTDKFVVDSGGNVTAAGTFNGLTVSSGTISSGTWNGTAISTTYGGTGQNWSGVAQGSLPYFSATGTMSTLSPGTSGYVLTTQGASADPTWTSASSVGTNYWNLGTGTIYPGNTTLDLLLGASATTSAKFAFKNVLTGTPTASISGSTANVATFIDGNGNISTTNRADLVLGNSATYNSTGNILLNPNGIGYVGIGTTTPLYPLSIVGTAPNVATGRVVDIDGTLSSTTNDQIGLKVSPSVLPTASTSRTYSGLQLSLSGNSTTRLTNAEFRGIEGYVSFSGASGSLGTGIGIRSRVNNTSTGTITNAYSTYIATPTNTGTITNTYGLYVDTQTVGTQTNAPFAIYQAGTTNKNYFAGNVGIGTTSPTVELDVAGAASISGSLTFRTGAGSIQTTAFNPLTVGGSTTGNITLNPSNAVSDGYVAPAANGVTNLGTASLLWKDVYASVLHQGANLVCDSSGANCPAGAVSYWGQAAGAIYTLNNTADVLIGATATTSAKFAFKNVLTGTPTASISGSTANVALFMDGNGNISTTNRQNLVLGNSTTYDTTGNILLNSNGTGNVGIGTTSPTALLDVAGAASVSGSLTFRTGAGSIQTTTFSPIAIGGSTTGNITLNPSNAIAGGYVAPNTTNMSDFGTASLLWRNIYGTTLYQGANQVCDTSGNCSAATDIWSIADGALYPKNTSVDLLLGSTATTSAKFALKNVLSGVPTASISGSTTNVATFIDGNGNISTTNRANLVLGNSATYNTTGNVLINPNGTGRVGVGTTTPNSALEIYSAAGGINDYIGLKRGGTDWRIWVSDGTTGTASLRIGGNAVDSYAWQFDWTGAAANLFKSPNGEAGQIPLAVRAAGAQTANIFEAQNSGGTALFSVGSTGNITAAGVINAGGLSGVAYNALAGGGDTPAATAAITTSNDLFIGGDAEIKGGLYLTGKNIFNVVSGVATSTISLAQNPATINNYNALSYGSWLVNNSTNNGIAALMVNQSKGGDIFTASASGSPKFVIDNSGNVGIGTTGPRNGLELAKLDSNYITSLRVGGILQGTTAVAIGAETSRHQILFSSWRDVQTNTVGAKIAAINWNNYALNNPLVQNTDLAFFTLGTTPGSTDATTEKMRITAAGNVGIGTTSPVSKLDVIGAQNNTITSTNSIVKFLGDDAGIHIGNLAGTPSYGAWLQAMRADNFAFPLLLNPLGGNVGIGTTSPSYRLTLGGTSTVFGIENATAFAAKNSVGGYENYLWPRWSDNVTYLNFGSAGFNIRNNGSSSVMVMQNTGNVGIGTTSPDTKLEINGYADTLSALTLDVAHGTYFVELDRNGTKVADIYKNTSGPLIFESFAAGSTTAEFSFSGGKVNVTGTTTYSITGPFSGATANAAWTTGFATQNISTSILASGALVANGVFSASDQRLKENIDQINPEMVNDFMQNIIPVGFNWKRDGLYNTGFVAQDLIRKGFGYLVKATPDDSISQSIDEDGFISPAGFQYNVDYQAVVPILTYALQQQQAQIASHSSQLANLALTSDGDLLIEESTNDGYLVQKTDGSVISQIAALAEMVIANIKAGAIVTEDLATSSFTAFQGTVDNMLVKSGLVSPIVQTALISPLPGDTDVTVQIGSVATPSGQFAIQNTEGVDVATIDNQGNATFSGTLFAEDIKSKSLDEIQALLTQVQVDQNLLSQSAGWNVNTATDSASLIAVANIADLYVTNQAAINSLSVTNSLTIGADMVIQSAIGGDQLVMNSIDSLTAPLRIQSLAMAPVEIMAGLIRIDTEGNVQISGNLAVAGRIKSSGLTLQEENLQGMAQNTVFNVQDALGSAVATIDASGSASFGSISTPQLVIAGADATESGTIIDGVITTNSTIGQAVIPAGVSEITIKNPKVTDYTLVYVTPTSTTENYVLYVKSKKAGEFVVGFTNPISIDVNFNWWIVRVTQ
ncbi:TPA: hypothetical protein DCW32_04085 [Candidatus Woesebacteria bacterium]|nr:hypothetical protein [Candidatus Woesebacteria bacterium]